MNQVELTRRVRIYTRDLTDSIFRDQDIFDFINEGINRAKQLIPELRGMQTLRERTDAITHIPSHYAELFALYGASRCFTQDERHYQAGNLMNEFEFKIDALKVALMNGDEQIIDPNGNVVVKDYTNDYVRNEYFSNRRDEDRGVEGVM